MTSSHIVARVAAGLARRRLRRMAGARTLAWAIRVPLVTLALTAALLLAIARDGRPRRGGGRP